MNNICDLCQDLKKSRSYNPMLSIMIVKNLASAGGIENFLYQGPLFKTF